VVDLSTLARAPGGLGSCSGSGRRQPLRLVGCRPEKVWVMSGLRRVPGQAEEGGDAATSVTDDNAARGAPGAAVR